jgi:kinesin family protein 11
MQNVVRLHKSGSDATFQELSSLVSSNGHSIEEVRHASTVEITYVYLVMMSY